MTITTTMLDYKYEEYEYDYVWLLVYNIHIISHWILPNVLGIRHKGILGSIFSLNYD
jgi:hypothetical protein